MSDENSVIIYIEQDESGEILPLSLECISIGKTLADILNTGLSAFVIGTNNNNIAEELRHYNLEIIYTADNPAFEYYQPECFVSAFESLSNKVNPKAILMGNTIQSIDLAPRIAFKLKTGLITDCVGIEDSEGPEFIKQVYSSNVMAGYKVNTEPLMATFRTRTADPAERINDAVGAIVPIDIDIENITVKTEVIERIHEDQEGKKLENAEIIVAGGRGVGNPEGFEMLTELAGRLDAAVGASRPPIDLGWVKPNAPIGQTGEIVGPSVYIAVGISGSTQHLVGMSGSKKIIAVNKDANANIFKISDYGVVGNYEEVIPAFSNALKEG